MPSDRTFVTELATGLGTLGHDDLDSSISQRPPEMASLCAADWDRLGALRDGGEYSTEFEAGFANGRAFLGAEDALRGRRPRIVEWTGARRPPGDEVVPSDLRIDHVYLVSCKYLSRILHNPSPARLVDALLTQSAVDDARDWYQRVAQVEYQQLYEKCRQVLSDSSMPIQASDLSKDQRRALARTMRAGWPSGAADLYARLCEVVSEVTARMWSERISDRHAESMLWRLLRIGSAPYFILGTSSSGSIRLRIDSPWDWRQAYRLRRFEVGPQPGGQPRVGWCAQYEDRRNAEELTVRGHVEIRWSHGRFGQPPEAKVYLDSAPEQVPGYHLLERPLESASAPELSPATSQSEPLQAELWEGR